jgi:SlyX protein
MKERVTDLESRFMHQERTIHELSDIVYRQQQAIERHERELRQLRDQLRLALPSLTKGGAEEEPPPHY